MADASTCDGRNWRPSMKRVSLPLLMPISALVVLCAKKAGRVSRKLIRSAKDGNKNLDRVLVKLQLKRRKMVLAFATKRNGRKRHDRLGGGGGDEKEGVWRRSILMGYKCQPLNFSGAIHYDENGNLLDRLPPRSPRGSASPLPSYLTHNHLK